MLNDLGRTPPSLSGDDSANRVAERPTRCEGAIPEPHVDCFGSRGATLSWSERSDGVLCVFVALGVACATAPLSLPSSPAYWVVTKLKVVVQSVMRAAAPNDALAAGDAVEATMGGGVTTIDQVTVRADPAVVFTPNQRIYWPRPGATPPGSEVWQATSPSQLINASG